MSPGHHSTTPTGLGKGSGLVLMTASGFSASSFPQDNTETAGTYPSLELHSTCAAMPAVLGSSWGCLSLAAAWGEVQVVHGCTSGPGELHQGQGWAVLILMLVFILPTPAALSPLTEEPQNFGFAPAFDQREQGVSITSYQVRWFIIITGGITCYLIKVYKD